MRVHSMSDDLLQIFSSKTKRGDRESTRFAHIDENDDNEWVTIESVNIKAKTFFFLWRRKNELINSVRQHFVSNNFSISFNLVSYHAIVFHNLSFLLGL